MKTTIIAFRRVMFPLALGGLAPLMAGAAEADAPESNGAVKTEAVENVVRVAEPPPEPVPAEPEARQSRLVEEIVVTAQKREENLQEVPISIAAFSAEKLDALGIESAQDMARITPGLTITGTAGYSVVFLRGVGTDAFLPAADQSVPIYIDGINLVASQNTMDTLGRVERVEVLKGPQGTLFGRNATGGAISIVTTEPKMNEFFGDLKLEGARYDEYNWQTFLNLPLVDNRLAATVSAYSNNRDNYYVNTGSGGIIDEYAHGIRGKFKWQALEDLDLTLMYSYQLASTGGSLQQENTLPAPRIVGVPLLPADPAADRRIHQNLVGGTESRSELMAATLRWNLSWLDVKLLGSDQKNRMPFSQYDFDGSELPILSFRSDNQFGEQKTAELQLLSNADSPWSERFEWVAGVYYLEGSGGFPDLFLSVGRGLLDTVGLGALGVQLDQLLAPVGVPPLSDGVTLVSGGVLESESLSGYLQGTVNLRETFYLTLGGRVQRETRGLSQSRLGVLALGNEELTIRNFHVDDEEATQFSPRVVLKWAYDGESNAYASWSRGYKSPTINTVNFFSEPDAVKEEKIETYEIGLKSDWWNGNLRLNAALFHNRIKDLLTASVALTSGGVVRFDNANEAVIKGAEFDIILVPMPSWNPGLAITAAGTFLDSEYTDFPNGRGFDAESGLSFGPDGLGPQRDFTGNRVVRMPKYSYTLSVNQTIDVSGGRVELGVDTYYNDGFFVYPQNEDLYAVSRYQTLDARVSYFYDPWQLQFTVFGQNLTDEKYFTSVFVVDTGRYQTLNDPRVYGVRVAWTF
jgi:iron complex outermembrane receptor protein